MGYGKLILGAILVIGSIYAIFTFPFLLSSIQVVLAGIIPIIVALIGIFIVWLELDELRIERELKAEEKREKRKRK